jgi:hypothetical protein
MFSIDLDIDFERYIKLKPTYFYFIQFIKQMQLPINVWLSQVALAGKLTMSTSATTLNPGCS